MVGYAYMRKIVTRPLKPREVKFVEAKARGLNNARAAMEATGTTDLNIASTQASRMLHNVTVKEAIAAELQKQGITMENAIKPIAKALAHDDVEINLKGSDRYFKLVGAYNNNEGGGSVHFHMHAGGERGEYGDV